MLISRFYCRTIEVVLIGLLLFVGVAQADSLKGWPEIPLPDNTTLTVVTDDSTFNGVPMRAWTFSTWQSLESTIEFYRQSWATSDSDLLLGNAPGMQQNAAAGWIILSRIEDEFLITLQLNEHETKTAKGILGITTLPGTKSIPRLGVGVDLDSQAEIISDIESQDGPKRSRTIIAMTKGRVAGVQEMYKQLYLRKKWQQVGAAGSRATSALMFNKNNQEVNIAVTEANDGVLVTLVSVRH